MNHTSSLALARRSLSSSPMSMHYYEPRHGHGLKHDPFNSIVAPRPIGWIGSSSEGQHNLAPYSFFTAFNYRPPIIGFSSIGQKDTLRNIRATSNFTWNLATQALAKQMNTSSDEVPPAVSEFEHAGLSVAPSTLVSAPRVAESPVSFECQTTQIVQLTAASGDLVETWLVLGEVVAVHIDHKLVPGGVFDTEAAQPILRGGGPSDYYSLVPGSKFHMWRAKVPKEF